MPEGVGRSGRGPLDREAFGRTRYWGGWQADVEDPPEDSPEDLPKDPPQDLPEDPPQDPPEDDPPPAGPGGGPLLDARRTLEGGMYCEDVVSGQVLQFAFTQVNLRRLQSALVYVYPNPADARPQMLLMSELQGVLIRPVQDAVLAATYLGIIANWEVSGDLIDEIARALCTPMNPMEADQLAKLTNEIRQHITNSKP